jgi:NitT/TauT family transport system permease protein
VAITEEYPSMSSSGAPGGDGLAHVSGIPPRKSRGRSVAETLLPPILLGALIIAGWYFISYGILDEKKRFLLEPPHAVLKVGFLDWENFSEILRALWSSTKVAIMGLSISIVLGTVLATIMSQTKLLERAIFPYMVTLQAVPILALVPMISFWFGTGTKSRVIVCVIISLFPIIVNTLFGLQSADRESHDLFTLHHANRFTRLRKLMFPSALPAMFAGLRISAGLAVIGAIVGDFFFGKGEAGIGQRILRYSSDLRGEELLAAVIMSSVLGVSVFVLFGWIQTRATGKWHEAAGV